VSSAEIDFAHSIRDDGIVINAASELIEAGAVATKVVFEARQFQSVQITNRCNSDRFHAALGDFADPRDSSYRKRKKKVLYFVGLNHEEAVRLAPVGRNLCKELVGSYAGRSG
jgi:hypothetical protein